MFVNSGCVKSGIRPTAEERSMKLSQPILPTPNVSIPLGGRRTKRDGASTLTATICMNQSNFAKVRSASGLARQLSKIREARSGFLTLGRTGQDLGLPEALPGLYEEVATKLAVFPR